jgi:hypothetical protein
MTDRPEQGTPDDDRVRDVLRDLGAQDPTSMPPTLVARIEAALGEESRRREPGAPVVPLATRRRRSRAPWLLGAAAAAAVAVALPGLLDRAAGPTGAESAAESVAESVADLGADDAAQAPSSRTPSPQPPSSQPTASIEGEHTPFALSVSKHEYTQDRLAADAATALTTDRREAAAVPSLSAESPSSGRWPPSRAPPTASRRSAPPAHDPSSWTWAPSTGSTASSSWPGTKG